MSNKDKEIVESSQSKITVPQKNIDIQGMEDIPTSMIPIPFVKVVQPGSTNITLSSGEDALPGTFFFKETGESVDKLHFALLRAKRRISEFQNKEGEDIKSTTLGILGINFPDYLPFLLTVSVASFSNFGRLVSQIKKKKSKKAWEYGITATTEKREEVKGGLKVKYWIVNFQLDSKPIDESGQKLLDDAYKEFAGSLNDEPTPEEKELDEVLAS